jgi:hypothetical protein
MSAEFLECSTIKNIPRHKLLEQTLNLHPMGILTRSSQSLPANPRKRFSLFLIAALQG